MKSYPVATYTVRPGQRYKVKYVENDSISHWYIVSDNLKSDKNEYYAVNRGDTFNWNKISPTEYLPFHGYRITTYDKNGVYSIYIHTVHAKGTVSPYSPN